jgi:hypothetical protein
MLKRILQNFAQIEDFFKEKEKKKQKKKKKQC